MLYKDKKLAIFLPCLFGGGAERSMLNLAQGFARDGCQVDLVLANATGPYLSEVPDTINLVNLDARHTLTCVPALKRYLEEARPSAMISALTRANVAALWAQRLTGLPGKVVINEQNNVSSQVKSPRWYGMLSLMLIRKFYGWAGSIAAVSAGVADDLADIGRLPREDIEVIFNPVITPELWEKAKAPLDHPWFQEGQPPVLIGSGRMVEQKNFHLLIRAFAAVRSKRKVRLMILGEGEERAELEALAAELGVTDDISMPGFVDNPYAYVSRASMFVLSSRWEGLPTVLVEALACGTPMVATDCPSGPKEILNNGEYGCLVPVEDLGALVAAIELTLDGKAPRPPADCWKPYTQEAVMAKYAQTLWGSN